VSGRARVLAMLLATLLAMLPLAASPVAAEDAAPRSGIGRQEIGRQEIGRQEVAWQEVAWPFAFDPWPAGRAFRCPEAVCGAGAVLAVRPKVGLCNCATGVADDEEIDAAGDLAALARDWAPLAPGGAVTVGPMAGRARGYRLGPAGRPGGYAEAVLLSRGCDLLVATLYGPNPLGETARAAALTALGAPALIAWAERALGGS
jgi:hypothetical protein